MDEWKSGEPPAQGWYDVQVNGKDDRLQWWICVLNPRKRRWKDQDGNYIIGQEIKWTGQPSATYWG